MAYYAVFMEVVEMEGIIRLQPVCGFDATATAYFFALTCTECGEATSRDVCLYPDEHACPFGLMSKAFVQCYPKCADSGHMVRKCKNCGALGSVALLPGYGKPLDSMGEKGLAMILKISGYVPTDCHMVCDWIVTKVSGESFHVNDAGSRVYGTDGKEVVNLNKLKFSVNKIKKSDLP